MPRLHRLRTLALPSPAVAVAALALAACGGDGSGTGSSGAAEGTVVKGPGVQTTKPPWPLEKAHMAQRVRILGLPEPGKEKYHIHTQLRVYVDGLLVPVPAKIAFDPAKRIVAGLHTHDQSGVIHLEADKPFKATLGDVFYLWGLRLAANEVGGLRDDGDERVQAFVNGKPISDPAAHVLRKDDNIVVGYGKPGTFPTRPDTKLLEEANKGGSMACSNARKGEKKTSCVVGELGGNQQ
jgi:hypothetical protein